MENTTMSESERLLKEYAAISKNFDKTINDLNKGLKDCQNIHKDVKKEMGL